MYFCQHWNLISRGFYLVFTQVSILCSIERVYFLNVWLSNDPRPFKNISYKLSLCITSVRWFKVPISFLRIIDLSPSFFSGIFHSNKSDRNLKQCPFCHFTKYNSVQLWPHWFLILSFTYTVNSYFLGSYGRVSVSRVLNRVSPKRTFLLNNSLGVLLFWVLLLESLPLWYLPSSTATRDLN